MTKTEKMENLNKISKDYNVPMDVLKNASESFVDITTEDIQKFNAAKETLKHSVRFCAC